MKISFYCTRIEELWMLGPIVCWGELGVVTIGIALGWWEIGVNLSGI